MKHELEAAEQIVFQTSLQDITTDDFAKLPKSWGGSVNENITTFFLPRNTELAVEKLPDASEDIDVIQNRITFRKLGGSFEIQDPLASLRMQADGTVIISYTAPLSTNPQAEHEFRMAQAEITITASDVTFAFHHKMEPESHNYPSTGTKKRS